MTETEKFELSNEEDTLESIVIAFGTPMISEKFREEVGQILENSEKYQGIFTLSDDSSTTDKLSVEKLQEQLNTAKYFFKNILDVDPNLNKGHVSHLENCVRVMKNSAEKALAAIGGDDE